MSNLRLDFISLEVEQKHTIFYGCSDEIADEFNVSMDYVAGEGITASFDKKTEVPIEDRYRCKR